MLTTCIPYTFKIETVSLCSDILCLLCTYVGLHISLFY